MRPGAKPVPFQDIFRKHFYVTTSAASSPTPRSCARIEELGIDRVLFSVDYPFEAQSPGAALARQGAAQRRRQGQDRERQRQAAAEAVGQRVRPLHRAAPDTLRYLSTAKCRQDMLLAFTRTITGAETTWPERRRACTSAPPRCRGAARNAALRPTCWRLAALIVAIWLFAASRWIVTDTVVPWDSKNQFYAFFRFLAAAIHSGDVAVLESVSLWRPPERRRSAIADLRAGCSCCGRCSIRRRRCARSISSSIAHLLIGGLAIGAIGWRARWPVGGLRAGGGGVHVRRRRRRAARSTPASS